MKKYFTLLVLVTSIISTSLCYTYNIGLLIVATGKYIDFVKPLIDSAHCYFCLGHNVTYFVFTDGALHMAEDVIPIYQKKMGWPYDTLLRIPIYNLHRDRFKDMDYLFAIDADMLFVDMVGDEILSDRVATEHPGYVGRRGTYETRGNSMAYVASNEGTYYFAGGFHGGSTKEFLKMAFTVSEHIQKDLDNNIVAVWHDESHVNRYFIDNRPTKILSPSYCMPGSDALIKKMNLTAYPKKLLALVKDHTKYRK